jgi:hypothetical protein
VFLGVPKIAYLSHVLLSDVADCSLLFARVTVTVTVKGCPLIGCSTQRGISLYMLRRCCCASSRHKVHHTPSHGLSQEHGVAGHTLARPPPQLRHRAGLSQHASDARPAPRWARQHPANPSPLLALDALHGPPRRQRYGRSPCILHLIATDKRMSLMTAELRMLTLSVALGIVQIIVASHAASFQRGYRWTANLRD